MGKVPAFIIRFEGGVCHTMMWILNHHAYEPKKDPASSTLISYLIISNIMIQLKKKSNGTNLFLLTKICTKDKNEATDKLCWAFISSATTDDDLFQQDITMVLVMTVSVSLIWTVLVFIRLFHVWFLLLICLMFCDKFSSENFLVVFNPSHIL